jgi:outer membrane protein insertion porin family
LSYQLTKSSTKDPEVNVGENADQFIPVVYRQPSIITSRVTATFAYDARDYRGGIDPTAGRELTIGLAFAGLLGDVRTYNPSIEFQQFYPVRNKKTDHPQVFAFRLLAQTVGSFATSPKIRSANSLAFVDGVPIYERFFLGDEFSIRGYPPRGISPFTPLDFYISSRNVVLATNATGTPVQVPGLPQALAGIGVFTGPTGNNVAKLSRLFVRTGGDTQLLGNFEYRIPLIGRTVGAAFFADIGSSFNFRTKGDQTYSSEFLPDQPFLSTVGFISCPRFTGNPVAPASLSTLVLCNHPHFAASPFLGLVARDDRIITQDELIAAQTGDVNPLTLLPFGMQTVYLRGEAQTNTVARLGESKFSKIGNFHSSLGAELRVQVPVLNVPFRLIYAYNPRARRDQFIDGFPFIFNEDKRVFRFSVGRTF